MLNAKLHEFVRALLFGKSKYKLPVDINISKIILDLERYIDVENAIRNGGILSLVNVIRNDFDNILNYIARGNDNFYNGARKNTFKLKLQSEVAKYFFNEFSLICRGDLETGVTANSAIEKCEKIEQDVDKIIMEKLPRPSLQLEKIEIPDKNFRNVLKLYDVTCKSLGKIVDPFSMVLVSQKLFVHPVHFENIETLKHFCKYYPENNLTKCVKDLISSSITAVLNADERLLPDNLLENQLQIKKFIQNINVIDNYVERVETEMTPPKLIDLFQRLLALVNLDKMWISESLTAFEHSNCFFCNLYVKNLELENENKLLKLSLNQAKNS